MIHDQCISALRAVNSNLDYSFVPTSRLKQLSLSMLVIWQNVVGNIGQCDSSDEIWGLRIFPYFICKTCWLFWQQVFYVHDWITPDLSGVFYSEMSIKQKPSRWKASTEFNLVHLFQRRIFLVIFSCLGFIARSIVHIS
jgi:hypothetical protein